MSDDFVGFSAAGIEFLNNLRSNNNKAWFDAHKDDYIKFLRNPATIFVAAMGEKLQTIAPEIRFDTRTNGSGSLMRINRDTRFSEDKAPYKTNIAMMFWEGPGKKMEHPGFGMQIGIDEAGLMAGVFGFSKPMLTAYREAVADDKMGKKLQAALDAVRNAGDYTINGEHYKRVPRGYDSDHPRADLLRYAGLWASSPPIPVEVVTRPEFLDTCFEHFRNMAPIQRWLVDVEARITA